MDPPGSYCATHGVRSRLVHVGSISSGLSSGLSSTVIGSVGSSVSRSVSSSVSSSVDIVHVTAMCQDNGDNVACGPIHILCKRDKHLSGIHFEPIIRPSQTDWLKGVTASLTRANMRHEAALRSARLQSVSLTHVMAAWGEEWIRGEHSTTHTVGVGRKHLRVENTFFLHF